MGNRRECRENAESTTGRFAEYGPFNSSIKVACFGLWHLGFHRLLKVGEDIWEHLVPAQPRRAHNDGPQCYVSVVLKHLRGHWVPTPISVTSISAAGILSILHGFGFCAYCTWICSQGYVVQNCNGYLIAVADKGDVKWVWENEINSILARAALCFGRKLQ